MAYWVLSIVTWAAFTCPFHGKYGEWHPDGGIAEIFRQPTEEKKEEKPEKTEEEKDPQPVLGPKPAPTSA